MLTLSDLLTVGTTVSYLTTLLAIGRRTVLIHRPAGIGDIVCTEPAVRAFRDRHPGTFVVYATRREFIPIVAMTRCADLIIPSDIRGSTWMMSARWYSARYELLVGDEYPVSRANDKHLIDQFSDQLAVSPSCRQPRLKVDVRAKTIAKKAADAVRTHRGLLIAIHVGPSWPVREWSEEKWNVLVEALRSELGADVVQLGADVSTGTGHILAPRIRNCVDWVGKWSLTETAAVIATADLLIGIDSGLLHIAGGVGTPCVGLFGAIDGRLRLPPQTPSRCVMGDVECLGCNHLSPPTHWRTGCPNEIACMSTLNYRDVLAAATELLANRRATDPNDQR